MARINLGRVVGFSAYEEAVRKGFKGNEQQWLDSLKGDTAYELAVKHGYEGTEESWVNSLKGKSAYEAALDGGFQGTENEFNNLYASITSLNDVLDYINGEVV